MLTFVPKVISWGIVLQNLLWSMLYIHTVEIVWLKMLAKTNILILKMNEGYYH